jgi:hypothetical protein
MEPTQIDVQVTTCDGQEWSYRAVMTRDEGPRTGSGLPRRLAWNLFFLALVGLTIALLVAVYTDAFSAVAAALGLGGVFVWIAFLKDMLSDERKAQLQAWFESVVLMSKITPVGLVLLFVGLAGYLGRNGVVVLDATGDGEARLITVRLPNNTIAAQVRVAPNSKTKVSLPAFPPTEYRIEARDLPFVAIRLRPLSHEILYIPTTFEERPLTIIRVDPALAMTENFAVAVSVIRNKRVIARTIVALPSLKGCPIWVGCSSSVPVPRHMMDLWRMESGESGLPSGWEKPPAAVFDRFPLRANDVVTAELLNGSTVVDQGNVVIQGGEYLEGSFKEIHLK